MKKVLIALVLTFAVSTSFAQKLFEGHIKYKFQISGEGAESMEAFMPTSMELFVSKKGMVTKMNGGMMAAMMGNIIVNDNGAYILQDAEKKALEIDKEEMEKEAAEAEEPVIEKLKETEKIQGYKCQKYKTTTKDESGAEVVSFMWVCSDYKMPEFKSPTSSNVTVKGVEGMVLKTSSETMGFTVTLLAEEIDTKAPDKAMFSVPSDYTVEKFDVNSFGGGMGGQ